jgi:hypothetical protein
MLRRVIAPFAVKQRVLAALAVSSTARAYGGAVHGWAEVPDGHDRVGAWATASTARVCGLFLHCSMPWGSSPGSPSAAATPALCTILDSSPHIASLTAVHAARSRVAAVMAGGSSTCNGPHLLDSCSTRGKRDGARPRAGSRLGGGIRRSPCFPAGRLGSLTAVPCSLMSRARAMGRSAAHVRVRTWPDAMVLPGADTVPSSRTTLVLFGRR